MRTLIPLIISVMFNMYLTYVYYTSYKVVLPEDSYPTTGQSYTITHFQGGNFLHLTPNKGKEVFYVNNPSCYKEPCSGDKIWVDLDALEIYIENEDITYIEFENREELIFYLGADLYKRVNKNKNKDTQINQENF